MKRVNDNYAIKPTDTLRSLFGAAVDRNHGLLENNEVYVAFQKKFRSIFAVGRAHGVGPAEVLLMINKTYSVTMEDIPFDTLGEMISFIRDNADTRYKIIQPELHAYLLKTNYYNTSSTAVAPKAMVIGFMKTTYQMMRDKVGSDKIRAIGIEVSKV